MLRRRYDFTGIIQGVGFRPCVTRLAREGDVSGWIQNCSGSVRAEFVANADKIDTLLSELNNNPPPLSRIDSISLISEEPADHSDSAFHIIEGLLTEESGNVMIPADVAMCADCQKEVTDPDDRRYMYPFTTCVNCGPRYTVITGMPYERSSTTMTDFPLCDDCRREYEDSADRRFHAETTCCPACGPTLTLIGDKSGNPIAAARQALASGNVVAIKGIGGFLLAIDPLSPNAVLHLRERKNRPHKPFAVMARSIDAIRSVFEISDDEEALLLSPQAPIVILKTSDSCSAAFDLATVAPDTRTLGVMLPTSPLHMLLFEPGPGDSTPAFDFLVMTSGNRRSEPICLTTEEAVARLSGIADTILTHNRDIALRNDDSLCVVHHTGPQVWRRARGFSPSPITLRNPLSKTILAMGAEIKNTLAIGYDREVVISPHIGDLETPEAIEHMSIVAETLPAFLRKDIEAVAVDLNPDMHSSITGRRIAEAKGVPVVEVQHHEAHALACLAENGLSSGLALTFDGTGLGSDNTIWGAELFKVEEGICTRLATFRPAPLPGGDSAVRQPARQLIGRLIQAGIEPDNDILPLIGVSPEECAVWTQQIQTSLNCPMSSGAGRLFDAVASLVGCAPAETTYEGQPAIRLESLARQHSGAVSVNFPFRTLQRDNLLEIDWAELFGSLPDLKILRDSAAEYALAFHMAVIDAAAAMIEYGIEKYPCKSVALSGGVMMNRIIHRELTKRVASMDLTPLTHSLTPPNDGCISLGQIVAASYRMHDAE